MTQRQDCWYAKSEEISLKWHRDRTAGMQILRGAPPIDRPELPSPSILSFGPLIEFYQERNVTIEEIGRAHV